ncbi:MAG: hydroxymethylbilane synthase [Saprospiraceae bacterium]|nr:hydroxymethylbilane synthase [Lewinellaceae bacterium]
MLKIGIPGNALARWQAEFTQTELQRIGAESEIVVLDSVEAALLRGVVQLTVGAMHRQPVAQPEGLVITAVSRRANPADLLVIRPESVDKTQIFRLKKGATVNTTSARQKAQLLDIRPDVDVRATPGDLQQLHSGAADAIFLEAATVQALGTDLADLDVLELHPREFVPAPAQGVLAWLTHRDDLPTRRLLKQLHHSEVSALTNVERRVVQLLDGDASLGVYVERDAAGNYHAFAAAEREGALQRARLSQNTNAGLAEKLVAQLQR